MAPITGTVRDIGEAMFGLDIEAPSTIHYTDGFVPATTRTPRIIQPVGVIGVSGSAEIGGTTRGLSLYHAAHAVLGSDFEQLNDTVLDKEKTDSVSADTTSDEALEEWATDAGEMDGKSINAGKDMAYSISAKRATSTVEGAHLEIKIFHRTTGGTETELAHVIMDDNSLTTSYQFFTGTWSVSSNQAFGTNELLVVKIRLFNEGVVP